jgi:hypothetical protein
MYAGRRGFVIGNGPSLKIKDLDRIKGDICIASNKIYLAFDQTDWRPTYLTCADKLVWDKISMDLSKYISEIITINTLDISKSSVPVVVARHRGGQQSQPDPFSIDCGWGILGGYTVTYLNLQIAAHLGLNPIYIIGCDHYYSGESDSKRHGSLVTHEGHSNHFIANYRTPGEKVNSAPIEEMNIAFETAARVGAKCGLKIFNATRGGYLEAFERCDFDAIADLGC